MVHDDGDEEDLEEIEASEAVLALERGVWSRTYADLLCEYVKSGVRHVRLDDETGEISGVEVVREALPSGESAEEYFSKRDVYVGNMYGHTGSRMILATSHGRHMTTSCRDPFVVVVPKQERPRPYVACHGWRDCTHVKDEGWPDAHPASASIISSGKVSGKMVRTQACMFAALRWPAEYEFVAPKELSLIHI